MITQREFWIALVIVAGSLAFLHGRQGPPPTILIPAAFDGYVCAERPGQYPVCKHAQDVRAYIGR